MPDRSGLDNVQTVRLEGPKGESVFWRPLAFAVGAPVLQTQIAKLIEEAESKIRNLTDVRARILVGSLLVERAVLGFLSEYLEKSEIQELTFAMQIRLGRSLRLCPRRFFTMADNIRVVRNEFAHQLTADRFEDLTPRSQNALSALGMELSGMGESPKLSTPEQIFTDAVVMTVVGLAIFASHLRGMRAYIGSAEFIPALKAFASQNKQRGP